MFKLFKDGCVWGAGCILGVAALTVLTDKISELINKNEASKEEAQD